MVKKVSSFFSASILSGLMVMTVPHPTRATESMPGRYVFEYCHSSSTAGHTLLGFYIDNEGAVWRYDHSAEQWWPRETEGLLYEVDLQDKYRNPKQLGTVDKAVLSAMVSLIEPAAQGETKRTQAGADAGSTSYIAYLYDPGAGTYKEVLLSSRGDWIAQNTSSAAKTLAQWLESVFFQNRPPSRDAPKQDPTPSDGHKIRERAVNPQLKIIQKIPAPKPDIKVEIKGPYPVEQGEQQNH